MKTLSGRAKAGEEDLAYSQAGEGRDVVLIHGALSTRIDMNLGLMERLVVRYRVTSFDRPGHGESSHNQVTGTPGRQAETILHAASSLALRDPIIIGHSFGGAVALACAIGWPEKVKGIVALAPIVFAEPRLEQVLFAPRAAPVLGRIGNRLAAPMVDAWLLPLLWRAMFLPQAMPARFAESFPFALAGGRSQIAAAGEDAALMGPGLTLNMAGYRACRTPVRILGGARDIVVANRLHGKMLAQLTPSARFQELPGLGHMIQHFAQDEILQAIDELAGGPQGAAG